LFVYFYFAFIIIDKYAGLRLLRHLRYIFVVYRLLIYSYIDVYRFSAFIFSPQYARRLQLLSSPFSSMLVISAFAIIFDMPPYLLPLMLMPLLRCFILHYFYAVIHEQRRRPLYFFMLMPLFFR